MSRHETVKQDLLIFYVESVGATLEATNSIQTAEKAMRKAHEAALLVSTNGRKCITRYKTNHPIGLYSLAERATVNGNVINKATLRSVLLAKVV